MRDKETCHRGARRSVPRLGAPPFLALVFMVLKNFVAADRVPPLCVGPVLVHPQVPGSNRSGLFFSFLFLFASFGSRLHPVTSCHILWYPVMPWAMSRVMSGHTGSCRAHPSAHPSSDIMQSTNVLSSMLSIKVIE